MGKWYDDEVTQAILHKKYLHEGENSFDDLVNRVSSIYSEDIREEVKTALYNADLSPAGRTLYAAGMKNSDKKLSCSNCFTAGMKVNTTEGLKNIEDINVDDLVVTETGVHPVEAVSVRPYRGDLYKISGRGLYDDIVCTPNHKFLTYDGWKRADRLFTSSEIKGEHAKGCCSKLRISNIYKVNKHYDTVDLSKITLMDNNSEIIINDNNTLSVGVHISSKFYKPFMHKFGKVVNRYIELDEDFRYFIGRWLGDGSVTTRRGKKSPSILQIVFNATTEREAAQRIINIGTRVFGFSPAVRETEQNVIAVRFENPIIATWFYSEFGRGCDGKYLPDKYLGDMQIAYGLFDSDGLLTSHGTLSITLKNIKLITWLKDTLYMNGIICNYIKATEHKDTYKLTLPTSVSKKYINPKLTKTYHDCRENISIGFDRYVDYIKVENIEILEDVNTTVYNLQIADDHTYNVNGVVVHNCYIVTSPSDDLESINSTDYEMSKIGSRGGGTGLALDHIRPKGAKINNSAKVSDGVAFCLHKYNQTGESIGQGNRRMAIMVMLDCKHPDIEEFLHIKANGEKLSAMNISIKFHEDFFEAVEQNKDYELYFKVESTGEEIKRTINARQFFEEFCKVNADWGDPGICYIDRVRDYHLLSGYPEYIIETSNP